MDEQQGTIKHILDCGTIVQLTVETQEGTRVLAADGNAFRRAQEAIGRLSLVGVRILFEETPWSGGLASFSIAEDTDTMTYCKNCRRLLGPHLNANFCVFGKHPLKALPPWNGASHE